MWKAREVWAKYRGIIRPSDLPKIKHDPNPDYVDDSPYSAELAKFQKVLVDVLLSEELSKAVDREGESALKHTGLGADERKVIASIPPKRRELIGRNARIIRAEKAAKLAKLAEAG